MLTKRQKQVLDFIKSFTDKKGYAPTLEEIKQALHVSAVSTVYFHVDKLIKQRLLQKNKNEPRTIKLNNPEELVRILLAGTIAAGSPIEAIQEIEYIAVPKNKLPRTGDVYALRVTGDSMVDEGINNGDTILVKQQGIAQNGQKIVALINNHEATLKKYFREGNRIRLQPANKNFEPIIITGNQNLLIQGVVLNVIKSESNIAAGLPKKKIEKKSYWKIEKFMNQVIEGDCLNVLKNIPPKSVDMILCDLPYGTTQNQWDSVIPLDKLWKHYEKIIKDKGVIVLTAQGQFAAKVILSNHKLFKYKIIWVKSKPTNFLNAKKQPLRKHEDILVFYKEQPFYNPQMSIGEPYNKGFRKDQLTGSYGDFKTVEVKSNGERYPTDVVYFKTAESEGQVFHPTQKPVELGRYLIRTFSRPGEIVLDNACGSGSFLVAAVLEDRKFIGIEKNQEVYLFKNKKIDYMEVCTKRIKKAREQFDIEKRKLNLL